MKVSVCMITYNHENFIAQAIESVLMQQTDFDYELIIGEDCSTDGTRKIVEDYQRRYPDRIRALLPDQNLGMMRNAAQVYSACGRTYIAFLEGDDYWTDPHKLQKQVQLMDANPQFSMCGSATKIVGRTSDSAEADVDLIRPKVTKPYYVLTDFLDDYPMHTSSVLLRRGLVTLPAWMEQVSNGDICIFALHAEKGPVGYLNEITSCYRVHGGGIWTSGPLLEKVRVLRVALDLLDVHFGGRYRRLLRRGEYRFCVALTQSLMRRGMPRDARKTYWEATHRLAFLMPLKVLLWGLTVHGGYQCRIAWNHVTMRLAVRTRLRRLMQRWRTRAGDTP